MALPLRGRIVEARKGFQPAGFAPDRREHLDGIVDSHFWFPARQHLVLALIRDAMAQPRRALDIGCGSGALLGALSETAHTLVGLDAYEASLARAAARAPAAILIAGDACSTPLADCQFDLVVALDVLEHNEPRALLGEIRRLLAPGGRLFISVPAGPRLWGPLDEVAGHRRRYDRRSLRIELEDAGLTVERSTHYQAALWPLFWLSRHSGRLGRRVERQPPWAVNAVLGAINRLEVALTSGLELPWGTSLLVRAGRA